MTCYHRRHRPHPAGGRRAHDRRAWRSSSTLIAVSGPRAESVARGPRRTPGPPRRRRASRLPRRRPPPSAPGTGTVAPAAGRPAGSPGRDHRAGRAQDDDQRARTRAPGSSWPTSRTRTRPRGTTSSRGQINVRDAYRRDAGSRRPTASSYRLDDDDRHAGASGPAAGTSPRSTCCIDGDAGVGEPVRLRTGDVPQRTRGARPRHRPVLLSAQAREPSRGAAVERRVLRSRRTDSASPAAPSGRPC